MYHMPANMTYNILAAQADRLQSVCVEEAGGGTAETVYLFA